MKIVLIKKTFILLTLLFFLSSCISRNQLNTDIKTNNNNQDDILINNTWSNQDWNNQDFEIDLENKVLEEDISNTWSENLNAEINLEKLTKVESIEEQYCKSKWWKIIEIDEKNICFTTDNIWLLKCEIWVFYMDKCRDKSAIIKDWIVIDYYKPKPIVQEKIIENTWSIKDDNKNELEKDLWNGFIFKEDNDSKYLYFNNELIIKINNKWKILMWLKNGDIYPFNIYYNKLDKEPWKIINVNVLNWFFTEQILKEEINNEILIEFTKTWSTYDNQKIDDNNILKESVWTTGIYYMTKNELNLKLKDWWKIITIFPNSDTWTWIIKLQDYELLINKQVKIFYFSWTWNILEEKIIDLNNLIE